MNVPESPPPQLRGFGSRVHLGLKKDFKISFGDVKVPDSSGLRVPLRLPLKAFFF